MVSASQVSSIDILQHVTTVMRSGYVKLCQMGEVVSRGEALDVDRYGKVSDDLELSTRSRNPQAGFLLALNPESDNLGNSERLFCHPWPGRCKC